MIIRTSNDRSEDKDIGVARARPSSWKYRDKTIATTERVIKKTKGMCKTKRHKYLNAIKKRRMMADSFSEKEIRGTKIK